MKGRTAELAFGCGLVWLATGCQHLMWYGYDPGRTTPVALISRCGEQYVEVGDREHTSFDAIALETLRMSERGRVAYAAHSEDGWFVVVDGHVVGPSFSRVSSLEWAAAPDTLIAVVGDAAGDRVLRLGVAASSGEATLGPAFDAVAAGSIVSSTRGALAYVGWRGRAAHVVTDGKLGPAFDGVASLSLSTDGRTSYSGRRGEEAWVVRRGELDGPYEDVAGLFASPNDTRLVALVRSDGAWHADDGVWRSKAYDRIGEVSFATDATKFAFRAGRGDEDFIVVDGDELGPYPTVIPSTLVIGGPTNHVAFAVRDHTGAHVVVDGASGEPWVSVEELTIGPDGRVGFIAGTGHSFVVVIDGEQRSAWSWAGDLRLSNAGHDAFVGHSDQHDVVVADGQIHPFAQLVQGSLRFASDGATWGVVAVNDDRLVLSTSNGTVDPIDLEEVVGEMMRQRSTDDHGAVLDRIVTIELEKTTKRGRNYVGDD